MSLLSPNSWTSQHTQFTHLSARGSRRRIDRNIMLKYQLDKLQVTSGKLLVSIVLFNCTKVSRSEHYSIMFTYLVWIRRDRSKNAAASGCSTSSGGRSNRGGRGFQELYDESHREAENEQAHETVEKHARHEVDDAHHHDGLEEVLALHDTTRAGAVMVHHFWRPPIVPGAHPVMLLHSPPTIITVHDTYTAKSLTETSGDKSRARTDTNWMEKAQ